MHGTASKLGKMLMHIKWIVLAKENIFLLSRPVALYLSSSSASTDKEKATPFNLLFHSVFFSITFVLPSMSPLPLPGESLHGIQISESDTFKALSSLHTSKASGPDNIGPNLLKHCAIILYIPFHYLLTQCLHHSILTEWQIHSITPIHKSGDKVNISNYRPISLLWCMP